MEYTHMTYETQVRNPECEPAIYNPGYQRHNSPSWMPDQMSREQYEAACVATGVSAVADADIARAFYTQEWGLEYWQSMDRTARVQWQLGRRRQAGMVAEARQRRQSARPEMVRCSCGHTVPRSQVMQASRGTACPDCYDRLS